jgi:cytochrome b6-f complex iron-sulfur subunit
MAEAAVSNGGMTRREFLYYIWGASMALFTAEMAGLIIWFAIPRFREGEFGGTFTYSVDSLPEKNAPPNNFPDGRFWLVNLDTSVNEGSDRMYLAEDESEPIVGVAAIYKVCTHLGCIYDWNVANQRFECPCHGSKYRLDGRRIESPAPRSLDRFELAALDANNQVLAVAETGPDGTYAALPLPDGTAQIQVNTGARLDGPSRTLICDLRNNCP